MNAPHGGAAPVVRDATGLAAWSALDELEVGILLLSPDLRVAYANARWASWYGGGVPLGTDAADLMDETDALDALRATLGDGQARPLALTLRPMHADLSVRRVYGSVRR